MSNTWWKDPPKNNDAGGGIVWSEGDDSLMWVDNFSSINKIGYVCTCNNAVFPWNIRYSSYSYQMYFKFQIPSNDWIISSAHITAKVHNVGFNVIDDKDKGHALNVYTAPSGASYYPNSTLSSNDYDVSSWSFVGEWEDIWDIYGEMYPNYDPYWLPFFDVTSEFKSAKNNYLTWFAIAIIPEKRTPYDWDYYTCPGWDKECWVDLFNSLVGTEYYGSMPSGYPDDNGLPVPWLKVVYSNGMEQWEPGEENVIEEISCIGSDYQSQSALIGTNAGGLWRTWDGGANWSKVFETTISGEA